MSELIDSLNEFPPSEDNVILEMEAMDAMLDIKDAKIKELENILVEQHGVEYDGNMKAQHNMSAVGTLANWKFNQALGQLLLQASMNTDMPEASRAVIATLGQATIGIYNAIYKDTKMLWKGADNEIHTVQGESILESLEKAMYEVGKIVAK